MLLAQDVKPVSAPLLSGALSSRLPSWLHFSGEDRTRTEILSGQGFQSVSDAYVLNRLRLNLEAQPLRWLKLSLQGEDSRTFGQNALPAPAAQKNALDLRFGFLQAGAEEGPATLIAGRQPLDFGEGRLLADPGWSNVGRSFDALRLTLRRGRSKVDLFSGAVVKIDPLDFDQPTPGAHFYGAYGSLRGLAPNVVIEPYVFWRLEHNCKNEAGRPGNLDEQILGMRWAAKLPSGIDYGFEFTGQRGDFAGDTIRAWTGRWVAGYTLLESPHAPRVFAEYSRASGDADPRDGRRGTFDPLFPSLHDKYGLTDLFGSSNIVYLRPGLQYRVRSGLALAASYNDLRLSGARDGLYVAGKVMARSPAGSAGTHIGQEVDAQAQWAASSSTLVNAGYGRLFPGEFLRNTGHGIPYNLLFLSIAQRF